MLVKQTWRWFGPQDSVSINDMLQAGVQGVVTALHHIPTGDVWSVEQIKQRQAEIGRTGSGGESGLTWDVVESLPVSEDIKRQSGDWRTHINHYKQSMRNLAACGIEVICYNFMPVLDWTRTDLSYELANGAKCMRYDLVDFAAFDIHILRRDRATDDYTDIIVDEAAIRYNAMDDVRRDALAANVVLSLIHISEPTRPY